MRCTIALLAGLVVSTMLAGCQAAPPAPAIAVRAAPQPFCTRTLGTPECFADPMALPDRPPPLEDTPYRPAQPPILWWKQVAKHWD